MKFRVGFDEDKNSILKETRGVNFEDIIDAIGEGFLVRDLKHPSSKHPNQRIFAVNINNYIFVVPYVYNYKTGGVFLKTIYPSRKLTKKYLRSKRS